MSYFTDNEFWDLRGRGSAVDLFVDSCVHLLGATASLKQAEDRNMSSDIRVAFVGIATALVSTARGACVGDAKMTIEFFDYNLEGFGMKIEVAEDRIPEEFLAVFATDVTCASRVLRFRITKSRLESMVSDWVARRPVAPPK